MACLPIASAPSFSGIQGTLPSRAPPSQAADLPHPGTRRAEVRRLWPSCCDRAEGPCGEAADSCARPASGSFLARATAQPQPGGETQTKAPAPIALQRRAASNRSCRVEDRPFKVIPAGPDTACRFRPRLSGRGTWRARPPSPKPPEPAETGQGAAPASDFLPASMLRRVDGSESGPSYCPSRAGSCDSGSESPVLPDETPGAPPEARSGPEQCR